MIRGSFQIRDYEINPDLPPALFTGPTITFLPQAAREAFPFEEDLYAELDQEGLGETRSPPDMDEIRSLAESMARERYLSGLGGRTRFFLPPPSLSSALRYNRAEGLFLGGGVSHQLQPWLTFSAFGGFAFHRERPSLEGWISGGERYPHSALELFWNRPREIGSPSIAGVLNTFSSALLEDDYTDILFASGVAVRHRYSPWPGADFQMEARVEDHRPARREVGSGSASQGFRSVIPTDRGTWASLMIRGISPTPVPNTTLSTEILAGSFSGSAFGAVGGSLSYETERMTRGQVILLGLEGKRLMGNPPRQAHFRLGGRGTVPGYPYRSYEGDGYWLFRAETSVDLLHPFLRLRAFGNAGQIWQADPPFDPDFMPIADDGETLLSLGLGVGIGWDVLRLDLARGLRGDGDWEVILSVNPDFWPWL